MVALRNRVIEPTDHLSVRSGLSLAEVKPGRTAQILHVRDDADPGTARRLVDLGFRPGTQVRVVRRAPMADPVIFAVAGCEVALRRAQASCVIVSVDA
jgi:Fe2+ transport system protein FeoA